MIKVLGMLVFLGIAVAFVVIGSTSGQDHLIYAGIIAFAIVTLVALLVKLFPRFFESEENGKLGMKIISKAVRGIGHSGD